MAPGVSANAAMACCVVAVSLASAIAFLASLPVKSANTFKSLPYCAVTPATYFSSCIR